MRYEVLGPFRVIDGPDVRAITAPKVELLLTVLLIRANLVVPGEQLMTEIWGEDLPRRATAGLHVYVSQIRKFLHRPDRRESPVITRPPGYSLLLGSDELDFHHFQRLVDHGREHMRERRYGPAATCFETALTLCRGAVLDDERHGPILEGFRTWLSEARLECVELLTDARLMLGRHRELVGGLYLLTTEHPLRETFHHQLMLALYRSGRQGDALRAYQLARRTLNDELGLEPCQALQDLQRAILHADKELDLFVPA